MKMALKRTCISLVMLASFSAFADKIVITGTPVSLEESEGVYVAPSSFTDKGDYHYVSIGGTNRVCYASEQPALASLHALPISIRLSGNMVKWQCYEVDPTYFDIRAED